ncbi:hypothetical protein [Jannaschia aquimarina]|uniref:Sulfotransferase family protein n=1 Tax=Jannaschia aquimarina TaxID=935700 RepID=A0A0D1EBN3_9RHOB|nr:hypothetical protein [Jannaschia aquimarina]KIT15149.1 hypothetical protein jaqu_34770 [Jannaschia aquimarina]SNS65474.1 hypothetical protein SAMN05421775_101803 [Jannaschia aquimarina]
MSISPEAIRRSFDAILGRAPTPQELAEGYPTIPALRQALFNSEEFGKRYEAMRAQEVGDRDPVLIHLHIPRTGGSSLTAALLAQESTDPSLMLRQADLEDFARKPRAEKLGFRYIHGRLNMGAGPRLDVPYRYLCAIRRPGPRIHSVWAFIKRTPDHPDHETLAKRNMSFGAFLEYSVTAPRLRLEVDNGQIRRLSGETNRAGLGHERELLIHAIHGATDPEMIIGTTERLDALASRLVEEGYLADAELPRLEGAPTALNFEKAVSDLSDRQREILAAYTGWDDYLFDICSSLTAGEVDPRP